MTKKCDMTRPRLEKKGKYHHKNTFDYYFKRKRFKMCICIYYNRNWMAFRFD